MPKKLWSHLKSLGYSNKSKKSSQKCVKYLGIELDQNLSGMNTVDDI